MPQGNYTVLDDGPPVGTESFRCAPGPMGWRSFSEIDGLYEPSAESLCLLDMSIEIGQALDVDQASSHRPARGLLMVWRILPGVTTRTCCWERSWSR